MGAGGYLCSFLLLFGLAVAAAAEDPEDALFTAGLFLLLLLGRAALEEAEQRLHLARNAAQHVARGALQRRRSRSLLGAVLRRVPACPRVGVRR